MRASIAQRIKTTYKNPKSTRRSNNRHTMVTPRHTPPSWALLDQCKLCCIAKTKGNVDETCECDEYRTWQKKNYQRTEPRYSKLIDSNAPVPHAHAVRGIPLRGNLLIRFPERSTIRVVERQIVRNCGLCSELVH